MPSNLRGKTFVVTSWIRNNPAVEDAAELIRSLGGEVVPEIVHGLNYLVVLDRRQGQPSAEERKAEELNSRGAAIQALDWAGFRELISPTPEEALALFRAGDEGLAQWRRVRGHTRSPIDLRWANLRGHKLSDIVLYGVNLDGADLSGADLSSSHLGELTRVNLDGAKLCETYVPHLTDCSARNADFTGARFNPAVIVHTDFTGAKLPRVSGSYTVSEWAIFRNADLSEAMLQNSKFTEADFAGANLTRAFLDECALNRANFRGARLIHASLCRADLTQADLTGADLRGANLAGADLTEAAVEGANFEGANLYAAKLSALGPGVPVGLVLPPPVATERIGPNMRKLEETQESTGSLSTSIHVADGGGTEFVMLHVEHSGHSFRAYWSGHSGSAIVPIEETTAHSHGSCQAGTIREAMLELAQRWPDAELCIETVHVRGGSVKKTPKGLGEVALAAWHEAFGLPLPSLAERKARQAAERQRLLALLRGGPDGVGRWNDLRSEALNRAGHFRRSDLANCALRGAKLSFHHGSRLGGLDFQGSNFEGADLTNAALSQCNLMKCRFRNGTLDGASCGGSNLRDANFEGASLKGCRLGSCDCRGANFRNADLRKADFDQADLRQADLSSANLEGARFGDAQHDDTTRFPPGFVFPVKRGKDDPPLPRPEWLEAGSRVRVTFGPFRGMEGEVKEALDEARKVSVELTIFGRAVRVEFEYDDVEPAG
jgi:uncharacterized protein YjbI with pentapeptide repeats